MKLFYRLCVILLVIGIVMCAAGAAAGGDLYSSYYNGRLHGLRETRSFLDDIDDSIDDIRLFPRRRVDETDRYYAGIGMTDSERGGGRDSSASADPDRAICTPEGYTDTVSLTKLDFELGAGNYRIIGGDGFGILDDVPECLKSEIDSKGVWHLETVSRLFSLNDADREVTIVIPYGLDVSKIDLEVGAASVVIDTEVAADKIDIELGAGSLEFYSCGVRKELDADVGMGSLRLDLTGTWEDYRLDADVALGTITINGEPFIEGLAGETKTGTGACKLDFDLGMGSIEIVTAD